MFSTCRPRGTVPWTLDNIVESLPQLALPQWCISTQRTFLCRLCCICCICCSEKATFWYTTKPLSNQDGGPDTVIQPCPVGAALASSVPRQTCLLACTSPSYYTTYYLNEMVVQTGAWEKWVVLVTNLYCRPLQQCPTVHNVYSTLGLSLLVPEETCAGSSSPTTIRLPATNKSPLYEMVAPPGSRHTDLVQADTGWYVESRGHFHQPVLPAACDSTL